MPVATIVLTVAAVEERYNKVHVRGIGKETEFRDDSLGWFVKFAQHQIAIRVGDNKPDLGPGDRVRLTLERV
jgi:hypothetical protein